MPAVRLILKDEIVDILKSLAIAGAHRGPDWFEALAAVAIAIDQPQVAAELSAINGEVTWTKTLPTR
jgi:hypothetical protein